MMIVALTAALIVLLFRHGCSSPPPPPPLSLSGLLTCKKAEVRWFFTFRPSTTVVRSERTVGPHSQPTMAAFRPLTSTCSDRKACSAASLAFALPTHGAAAAACPHQVVFGLLGSARAPQERGTL